MNGATRSTALVAPLVRLPALSTRFVPVWRRNLLVWRKLAIASVLGNIADPLLYMLALGYGIGSMIGEVGGMSYVAFIGTGMVCQSAMFTSSFEGMYSAFSRMHVQRTWEAIMHTPLSLGDIVLGEIVWGASKALLSGVAIMLVAGLLGYAHFPSMLAALPVIALAGLAFASTAMIVTALAPSYDFFMFYQTLVLTPMLLLSGVFFPLTQLPPIAQRAAHVLPLANAVELIRPAMLGRPATDVGLHLAVLAGYAIGGFLVCAWLFRRRMMR